MSNLGASLPFPSRGRIGRLLTSKEPMMSRSTLKLPMIFPLGRTNAESEPPPRAKEF
jgi:hypothetical protein